MTFVALLTLFVYSIQTNILSSCHEQRFATIRELRRSDAPSLWPDRPALARRDAFMQQPWAQQA